MKYSELPDIPNYPGLPYTTKNRLSIGVTTFTILVHCYECYILEIERATLYVTAGYRQRWFRLKGNLLFYFKVDELGGWEVYRPTVLS